MKPAEAFIQQPIRSLQTMLQIIALDDERIPQVIPDGIYGQSTISAVNRFQQLYGLPATGITDQVTWEKLVDIYQPARIRVEKAASIEIFIDRNQVMGLGNRSTYVYFLQAMLLQLSNEYINFPPLSVNGEFDKETETAVRAFQKFNGLPQSGTVDKITWKNIVQQFTLNSHHNMSSI